MRKKTAIHMTDSGLYNSIVSKIQFYYTFWSNYSFCKTKQIIDMSVVKKYAQTLKKICYDILTEISKEQPTAIFDLEKG